MGNSGGKERDPNAKKGKSKKGKRGERRLSDPVGLASNSDNPTYGLRRAGSEDLTGTSYGGEVSFSPNPVQQDDPSSTTSAPSTAVHGTSALASETIHSLYKKRLNQVLSVWPELGPLIDIDFKSLRASAVDALQTLYQTLVEEHEEGEGLRRARGDVKVQLTTLEKRVHAQDEELRRKTSRLDGLAHEVSILTGELRRRGIEPRLLDRGDKPTTIDEPPSDYDVIPYEDHAPSQPSAAADGDGDAGKADVEDDYPYTSKRASGKYVATPLLQASGDSKSLGNAIVKRSQSLRQTGSQASQAGRFAVDQSRAPPEMSRVVDDLNQKVRCLQHSLDEEKKRAAALEERLDTVGKRGSIASYATGSGTTPDTLKERYHELEGMALSRVMTALSRLLDHLPSSQVSQFLCSTMLLAFGQAAEQYQRFQGALHALLTSPAAADTLSNGKVENKRLSAGNIHKFNFDKSRNSTSGSRLAQRTKASAELPRYLEEEVENFIRLSADTVNVEHLVETVEESLREKWPTCAIPVVLKHSTYSDFLHQCCRLAWQLNTTSPPCDVMADTMRYDERHHTVLPTQAGTLPPTIGAQVAYYAWPGLYRMRYGEVLHRGLVALTVRS